MSSASSSKDSNSLISQNIIEDTVCLRVARPDVEHATISNDTNNDAITTTTSKASAKATQKIKAKVTAKANAKNTNNTNNKNVPTTVHINDSSDSDSDDSSKDVYRT